MLCCITFFKLLVKFSQSTVVFACHGTIVSAQHRGLYVYLYFHWRLFTAGTEWSNSAYTLNSQYSLLLYEGAMCCVVNCMQPGLVWEGLGCIAGALFFTFIAMGHDPD